MGAGRLQISRLEFEFTKQENRVFWKSLHTRRLNHHEDRKQNSDVHLDDGNRHRRPHAFVRIEDAPNNFKLDVYY